MKDLIRSEWRRFRRLSLIVALCHSLALLLISRAADVLQLGYEDQGMMLAWLAGAHACTSRHKAAVAVLLAPLILALHLASVWWLLLPVLACLAWLVFVTRHGFRADRAAPITRHGVLLLTALPLQLGFFLLVFQLSKTGLAVVDLLGRTPGRTVLQGDPDVDVDAAIRRMGQDFIAKGLATSRD